MARREAAIAAMIATMADARERMDEADERAKLVSWRVDDGMGG